MSSRIVWVDGARFARVLKKTFECKKSAYSNFLPILDTLGDAGVSDALMSGAAELCLEGLEKRPLMLSLSLLGKCNSIKLTKDRQKSPLLFSLLCTLQAEERINNSE